MGKRRLSFALVGAASVLAGVAPQACRSKDAGAVIVAMQSDMDVPKDITHVGVFVSSDGIVKVATIVPATEQGDGRRVVKLPSTMAIVSNEDKPDAKVRVRVMAFQKDTATGKLKARVTRDARTTVPKERRALLRMPLRFISDGSAQGTIDEKQFSEVKPLGFEVNDEFSNSFGLGDKLTFTCPDGQTEIAGVCKPADVDSAALPEFKEEEVFGGATAAAAATAGECFNPAKVYKGAEEIKPAFNEATGDCTLALSSPQPADKLNFAFWTRNDKGGSGVCVPNEDPAKVLCFVPLDGEGSDEPLWTVAPGGGTPDAVTKVLFSPRVCQKLKADGIKLGRPAGPNGPLAIRAKTDKIPLCGGAVAGKEVSQDTAGQGDAPFDAGVSDAQVSDGATPPPDGGGELFKVEDIFGTNPQGNQNSELRVSGLSVVSTGQNPGIYFVRQEPKNNTNSYGYQLMRTPLAGGAGQAQGLCSLGSSADSVPQSFFGAPLQFQSAVRAGVVGLVKTNGAALTAHSIRTAFACSAASPLLLTAGPGTQVEPAAAVLSLGESIKWIPGGLTAGFLAFYSGSGFGTAPLPTVGGSAAAPVPLSPGAPESFVMAARPVGGQFVLRRCSLPLLPDGGPAGWTCSPLNGDFPAPGEAFRIVVGAKTGYVLAGERGPSAAGQLYSFDIDADASLTPLGPPGQPFFSEQGIALSQNETWLFFGTASGLKALRLADKALFEIKTKVSENVGDVVVEGNSVYWVGCESASNTREFCRIHRTAVPN